MKPPSAVVARPEAVEDVAEDVVAVEDVTIVPEAVELELVQGAAAVLAAPMAAHRTVAPKAAMVAAAEASMAEEGDKEAVHGGKCCQHCRLRPPHDP